MQPTQSPSPQASYIPSQSPPAPQQQQYHILQQQQQSPPGAILHHQQPPPGSQSPQSAQQGQPGLYVPQQAGGYALQTDGYVTTQTGGYSPGPQTGPPHQGQQVIRGIQSGAPPTPPQQDLNKMPQPPPQQMYVSAGGANGTGGVRQTQQLFRGGSTTPSSRSPRQNLAMSPAMFLPNQPVVLPHAPYHPPYATATRQQAASFLHFQNSQIPQFSSYQYFIPSTMIPPGNSHRGAAVPNQMVSNASPGMQTSVAQGQMVPSCVLAAPGQQGHMPQAGPLPEKKKRAHALPIIDPITKKNVLDDFDSTKSSSTSTSTINEVVEYHDQYSQSPEISEISSLPSQDAISISSTGNGTISSGSLINSARQIVYGTDVVTNKVNQGLDMTPVGVTMSEPLLTGDVRSQHMNPKTSKSDEIIVILPPQPMPAESPPMSGASMSDLGDMYDETDEEMRMDVQIQDSHHGTTIESNINSALQLESDLVQKTTLGRQSPIAFIHAKSSSDVDSVSLMSNPSDNSSASGVCSSFSLSDESTFSASSQPPKIFSNLSATSAPFAATPSCSSNSSAASLYTPASQASSGTSVFYSTSELSEETNSKTVAQEADTNSPKDTTPLTDSGNSSTASLCSNVSVASTGVGAKPSAGDKAPTVAVSATSTKIKDIKAPGQASVVVSSSSSISQEGTINKMTLNEKEVSKSATASSHGKTISSTVASDRKEPSKGTGAVVTSGKKPPPATSDRNDNIIPVTESDQTMQPSKKPSTDLPSANNNADNSSVGSYDTTASVPQTVDRREASLNNNNNVGVESKTSTESIQSSSAIASVEPSESESIEPAETTDDSSSDLNDNRTTGPTEDDSSAESTEAESIVLAPKTAAAASADTPDTDSMSSSSAATATSGSQPASLIKYNQGQWSPLNQDGTRTYDRSQLFALRDAPASKTKPDVAALILRPTTTDTNIQQQHSLLPSFSVRRHHMGSQSGGIATLRSGVSTGGVMPSGPPGMYGKQASMPGVAGKSSSRGSKTGMIYLNLSLGEEVKLNETENAWRPTRLRADDNIPVEERSKEQLFRKVRGILNKLTPEKFEILVNQIMSMQINTAEKIVGVMELVFEKAIDEPAFSYSYARLCQKLIEKKLQSIRRDSTMTAAEEKASNLVVFRNALLDKTQREFQENVLAREAKENQLRPILERIKECAELDKKLELQSAFEEQERKIRRRSGGTVRFIGELFKMSILNIKVTKDCIVSLLDPDSEDKLECLCKLLATVGKSLEKLENNDLDQTMKTMKSIVDRKKISSRVRFMLQDVIDLRKNKWESKRAEGPTTMEQIQKEVETEQLNSQMLNYNIMSNKKDDRRYGGSGNGSGGGGGGNSGGGGNGGGGMMSSGGNGGGGNYNKNNSDTWYMKTSKGNRAVDANKLGHMITCVNENPTKLGDVSQYQWMIRSNDSQAASAKSFSTTMNSFAALSNLDSNKGSNSGPRNKGSYTKNSMERDRHDLPLSRTGSTHGSRENSSSRAGRGATNTARSASHSYSSTQPTSRTGGGGGVKSVTDITRSDRGTLDRNRDRDRDRDKENRAEQIEVAYPDDSDTTNRLIKELVTKALEKFIDECPNVMRRYPEKSRWQFFYHIFCDYLHLCDTKVAHRKILAQVFMLFFKQNLMNMEQFVKGYSEFSQIAHEILIDVPDAWSAIFQFLVPMIYKGYIPLRSLWNDEMEQHLGKKFVKDLIVYCTREVGPNWMRKQWQSNDLKWTDFMPQQDVDQYVSDNKFEFIEAEDALPPILGPVEMNVVLDRVKDLLIDGVPKEELYDYLNGNIANVDKQFIRALTTTVCNFAIKHINKNHKLDKKTFTDVCVPLLNRFIDSKEERELECLFAIQVLIIKLEHPQGVLSELFAEMYENDVITPDSFLKWKDSKEEPNGKGVAVKGLTHFFRELASEISDENN